MTNPDRDCYRNAPWPEPVQLHSIDLHWAEIDAGEHPIIAEINRLAGVLAEILGPMFWAALIVLTVWAALH